MFYSVGVDYRFCKNLTFRTGIGMDGTPIKGPQYRTPRIPDQRRILGSLGVSYMKNNWQLDMGYTHIFIHHSRAEGIARPTAGNPAFRSRYHLYSDIVGMQFQYKF